MKIKLPSAFCDEHKARLETLGVSPTTTYRSKSAEVDLALVKKSSLAPLLELVKSEAEPRSALAVVARDIEAWEKVVAGGGAKPRNCQQLAAFLTEAIRRVPGHRIYSKAGDGTWCAYYVGSIQCTVSREGAPSVYMRLFFEELGSIRATGERYHQSDIRGTALEILAKSGYVTESSELRREYIETRDRFLSIVNRVGTQFTAVGDATSNLDGNPGETWNWKAIHLDATGRPARVVIDVFHETSARSKEAAAYPEWAFWAKRSVNSHSAENEREAQFEEAIDSDDAVETEDADYETHEIPVHPTCAVFDLRRHLRLRVHVSNLTEYVYNENLGDSLVLPDDVRRLVNLLMVQKGDFRDIVENKDGGAPILCAGPPGVGKTLTAEVYSEVMRRPLYSVQCSQLGLTPENLEAELLRCFQRAQRWNAILLLDEADVYVRARGKALQQNAIVGVFLRVMEYYGGALFLTTNRSSEVDDAIISRCIARIDYTLPSKVEQAKIWGILAHTAGIPLREEMITDIVEAHPDLSGRDIKNLLKLAHMFTRSEKKSITVDAITFARRFKPSADPGAKRQ